MVSCELILHESAILAEVTVNHVEFIVNRILRYDVVIMYPTEPKGVK